MYSNSEILSAVLNKWMQPLAETFMRSHAQSLPFVQMIENKVRSSGWVSPNWTLMRELTPFMESVTGIVVTPMISRYVSMVDDALLPQLAHKIVNDALDNGEVSLFEGKVVVEEHDLRELKRLLELNLPCDKNVISIRTE